MADASCGMQIALYSCSVLDDETLNPSRTYDWKFQNFISPMVVHEA